MHGLVFEIQKDFSGGEDIEFGERRTPHDGRLSITIKTRAGGFGG